MTQREFEAWREFYLVSPFDDRHRFHRPAALVASMNGKKMETQDALDWLSPEPSFGDLSDADVATVRALGFVRKGQGT